METPSSVIKTLASQSYPNRNQIHLALFKKLKWSRKKGALARFRRLESRDDDFAREIQRVLKGGRSSSRSTTTCEKNYSHAEMVAEMKNHTGLQQEQTRLDVSCEDRNPFDIEWRPWQEDRFCVYNDTGEISTQMKTDGGDQESDENNFCGFVNIGSDEWRGDASCSYNDASVISIHIETKNEDLDSNENSFCGFEETHCDKGQEDGSCSYSATKDASTQTETNDENRGSHVNNNGVKETHSTSGVKIELVPAMLQVRALNKRKLMTIDIHMNITSKASREFP